MTHAQRLERWLGADQVETLSQAMKDWYGPPIRVGNTPGQVYAVKGGDFVGRIKAGGFGNVVDFQLERFNRAMKRAAARQRYTLNAGFSSLADLLSDAKYKGKRQDYLFQKAGTSGLISGASTLWYVGNNPVAGGAAGAAAGGTTFDNTSTGAFNFQNPLSGDQTYFINGWQQGNTAPQTLLLYDRLFSVTKTMSSTATEAVTGVPTRYTNTTQGAEDSAEGNFLIMEVRAVLGATAHNWTVCQYTDQSGNTGATLPSVAGVSGAAAGRIDNSATEQWFCPLASGDTGIKALTQMQCDASVTGNVDFTIGHPIGWLPSVVTPLPCLMDGINSAFNLARIFDSACLALLEVNRGSGTATTYNGAFTTVSG